MNMPARASTVRNDYRCSMEKNQGGKYCVRIRVHYPRHAWSLGVFFLASSFDRAMKKLEQSLDFLQRHEEKLWFWGVDRAEDMGFSAEFLREVGMRLDKRKNHTLEAIVDRIILKPVPGQPGPNGAAKYDTNCVDWISVTSEVPLGPSYRGLVERAPLLLVGEL